MLYYQTINSATLELLSALMKVDVFNELRLAGGTSLALQIGHRKSVDLDLFGKVRMDELVHSDQFKTLGDIILLKKTKNISIFLINGIKVDIVNYAYKWLEGIVDLDEIRFANLKDIGAMKLAAITGRGTKKDFVDLFFLLKSYSIGDLMQFYKKKYRDGSEYLVLKSLTYFGDADEDEEPFMVDPIEWNAVKTHIITITEQYIKTI